MSEDAHCGIAGNINGVRRNNDFPAGGVTAGQRKALGDGGIFYFDLSLLDRRDPTYAYVSPACIALHVHFSDIDALKNSYRRFRPQHIAASKRLLHITKLAKQNYPHVFWARFRRINYGTRR